MEKTASTPANQSELTEFIKQVRENFQAAGKKKEGFFRTLLKKIFG